MADWLITKNASSWTFVQSLNIVKDIFEILRGIVEK